MRLLDVAAARTAVLLRDRHPDQPSSASLLVQGAPSGPLRPGRSSISRCSRVPHSRYRSREVADASCSEVFCSLGCGWHGYQVCGKRSAREQPGGDPVAQHGRRTAGDDVRDAVAVDPLDRVVGRDAVAAVQLQRLQGDLRTDGGAEQLGLRDLVQRREAALDRARPRPGRTSSRSASIWTHMSASVW